MTIRDITMKKHQYLCGEFRLNIRALIAVALLGIPSAVFGWTTAGYVSHVYSHDGYHVIYTNISDNPCGTPGKYYWPTSDSDAKDMLAIALTAFTSDARVAVVSSGSTGTCLMGGQLTAYIAITK